MSEQSMISVVDDDQAFRDSMRRLLRSLGYAVGVSWVWSFIYTRLLRGLT